VSVLQLQMLSPCAVPFDMFSRQNAGLLTKFVSDRGFILPKRFTHCCAKHQRQ